MVPFWFDSSFSSAVQWLPAVIAGVALFLSQLSARAS
jgi:hypothetical protein